MKMKNAMISAGGVILYILFMLLTYIPGGDAVLGSAFGMTAEEYADAAWLESLFYIPLVAIAVWIGRAKKRMWIITFPILAWLFDEVIALIPLVPTIFNIVLVVFIVIPPKEQNAIPPKEQG